MALVAENIVSALLQSRQRLIRLAILMLRRHQDADDVFQHVVLQALRHSSDFVDEDHLLAWGVRTCRNRALDICKQQKMPCLSPEVMNLIESAWGEPESAAISPREECLQSCLGKLTSSARLILKLRYFDGLSIPAIAEAVQRNDDAVYQILSRSHRALKRCVEIELYGEVAIEPTPTLPRGPS